jgi:hypothetical protein
MKKITTILILILAFAGMNHAQMVENFEHIKLNLMAGGENDNSTLVVVPNPDPTEANPSTHVVKFTRSQHGVPWGGFWSALPEPIDLTTNKYIHVQVWKPRVSPIKFKVEGGTTPNYEIESVEPQTLTEEWETIVFHFNDATGEYPIVAFMPDFADPVNLTEDIVIYFDNIIITNSPEPGADPVYVIENFEHIVLNMMTAEGEEDNSSMIVVPNPDPTGVNTSDHVVKFQRSQHGVPWGGFWSALPSPLDLSVNKYVYVDVWKPRISPIKFKVEAGPTEILEIESMIPQTKVEAWETIVFDFSSKDGQWNTIAFMPDFADPVDLTEDIVIYFDNIRVGPEPTDLAAPNLPDSESDISVFPNPVRDNLEVKTKSGSTVSLISMSGSIIDSRIAGNESVWFDVSDLPQGIYLVRVVNSGNAVTRKVIVH